ncbi:MAG: hypothetical protein LC744_07885 [Chloroflexi bacterium]|nr:hypothetical protein [Chloroflexota bacterium]
MPFLPFVLLLAWQALSRSASFALGWATAIYFGQVPGRQGHVLSVISLLAAAWVVLLIGFAIPIFGGAALEATGVIGENFDVETIHYVGLVAGLVLTPPTIAGCVVWANILGKWSIGRWLGLIPVSYPATLMLGISVLQMVLYTPVLLFQRWRKKRKLIEVALVMREGTDDEDLLEALRRALASIGIKKVSVTEAKGPKSWPLRTVAFAAEHLLGAVVRGEPMRLNAGQLEIQAYATNVSIFGPKKQAYRARAAVERELAFADAYLTWEEQSQRFEDELLAIHRDADGDVRAVRRRLDDVQERMDVASLNSEQWNVLYRLRLQFEQDVSRRSEERSRA